MGSSSSIPFVPKSYLGRREVKHSARLPKSPKNLASEDQLAVLECVLSAKLRSRLRKSELYRKIVIPKFSGGGSHAAAERAWEPVLLGQFKFWNSLTTKREPQG
jgi:hypothetical protein